MRIIFPASLAILAGSASASASASAGQLSSFNALRGLAERQIHLCTPVPEPATCEASCGPGATVTLSVIPPPVVQPTGAATQPTVPIYSNTTKVSAPTIPPAVPTKASNVSATTSLLAQATGAGHKLDGRDVARFALGGLGFLFMLL
ncbi:hypothetical protein FGG08_004491 [Glutinoglossum americanum]|uniref:Uncharacterized protein n=1 Tax=Glutinoglossum americanum TaxID=1670608 RepID=A0A9P8I0K6_9PEZI|nr:hypothetical protein FGG08_004491 [Glutinoglossum americanum]